MIINNCTFLEQGISDKISQYCPGAPLIAAQRYLLQKHDAVAQPLP